MDTKHTITIYSTPTCPYCVMAKEFFTNKGVEFKDLNVGADNAAAEEMVKKSGQMGVPVIDIDGKIVVGFRPDVFEKFLA
jgi:glutaredoxin-like YruB-family protein